MNPKLAASPKTVIHILTSALLAIFLSTTPAVAQEHITIDAHAPTTPFPHFWEKTFGSGRAILSLRESYRNDLRTVKQATGFESIRFHGILMDEVGLYDPARMAWNPTTHALEPQSDSLYNFSYVDQIYDGLLANGIRPYVELSFMPRGLAADPNQTQAFWYHPIVSPPGDYARWDAMLKAFAEHLVARYGLVEVATWKFEVWNEPNLDFWGGSPRQSTYWELYDHTARALKSVSARLQVGGPSTAQADWVAAFLIHTKAQQVPVDFVSTHVYANDSAQDVLKSNEKITREYMVARAVKKVHEEILHSAYPDIPLIFSEYGASYSNEPNVTDTTYVGPWLANTIRLVDGMTDTMAYWAFSDVFEEGGVVQTPFYGGFGLIAADSIPKPLLNAFAALHKLGDHRIALRSEAALATTDAGGSVTVALWNYAPPTGEGGKYIAPTTSSGPDKSFTLHFDHVPPGALVQVLRVDETHGNVLREFNAMGRPSGSLSREQIARLRAAGAMAAPEQMHLHAGTLDLTVPAHGLAVLLVNK